MKKVPTVCCVCKTSMGDQEVPDDAHLNPDGASYSYSANSMWIRWYCKACNDNPAYLLKPDPICQPLTKKGS